MALKELLPDDLYTKITTSIFQKFLLVVQNQIDASSTYKDRIRNNLFFRTMEIDWGIEDWESVLQLPDDPALSTQDRIARVQSYVSGSQGTAQGVKDVVFSYIEQTLSVDIRPRKDYFPSVDKTENYTYDIVVEVPDTSAEIGRAHV